ncbi:helix-turn-helix transcriptional regulator [Kamptonema formosum]|uniref:helix-turn-helix transcriptional regulator n=1 Tax=Kamptonema formosum TaxID=331992 RepID=UPI00034DA4DB|nr:hypothetical protein [Oscillatoria sp. PCC 10802]
MATDELFAQAAKDWDLDTLYADLASAKGKRLTPIEKLHLRGLLCGHSPAEIAERLNKNVKGVEVNFCNTIYQYVKNLLGKASEKVENWRNICEWLEEAGYKAQSSAESQSDDCLPIKFLIKKANITLDKNQVIIDINLRIIASSPIEPPIEDTDTGNGASL